MGKFFYSELVKSKRTFTKKLVGVAPFTTLILAFLMGGTNNLQSMGFCWWYAFVLFGFIAISCGLSVQREQRAGRYYSVYSMPIDLAKFWHGKILCLTLSVLIANLIMAGLMALTTFWGAVPQVIPLVKMVPGMLGVTVTSLWQIPFCLWLADRTGVFFPILIHTVIGLFSSFLTPGRYWWVLPYTWAGKISEPLLGIKSSGEMGTATDYNSLLIPLLIFISLAFFLMLTYFTGKWFARREVK